MEFIPGTPVRSEDAGNGARIQLPSQARSAGPVNKGTKRERKISDVLQGRVKH